VSNLIGQSLGRYHILEQLGEGGMAIVYKAYDTRLETDVAIKVIRTENILPSVMERALKRFEREAKALARLTHPNIVKVTDYGEYEGKPYLVMPYFPGGTLKEKIGKQIPWREALQILLPIAEALGYAHSQNMVHRDVKPSNILLTQSGQPMLTDFGIAKILDLEETQDLTGTNAAIGTPEYMAPEQATAKSVDHRADIYSFGIVLYEMLIGRKPYTADTPMAILIMHAHDPLPSPKKYVPDLPVEVERILLKALAKKPEDRYQSMGEMVKAFENLQGNRGRQPALESKLKIKPIALMILGLAALVLLAVFGLPFLIGKPESTPQVSIVSNDILIPKDTAMPTASVTMPIPTIAPARLAVNTPLPLEQGSILDECGSGGGLCLTRNGKTTRLAFVKAGELLSWSWAPDGNQFIVSYCPPTSGNQPCQQLYIVNIEAQTVTQLIDGPDDYYFAPAWSPDGKILIYNHRGGLDYMRFDGATWQYEARIQVSNTCPYQPITWAPDSRQVAWVAGPNCQGPDVGKVDRVVITDINTQITQTIFESADFSEFLTDGFASGQKFNLAWSPDGKFVVFKLRNGTVYQIEVSCVENPAGCDVSSRTKIDSIPANWLNNYYPQWGGILSPP
jgi:serine/threonine protein kinase